MTRQPIVPHRPWFLLILLLLLLPTIPAAGQGSKTDYERAAGLRNLARGKVRGLDLRPTWSADGSYLWFADGDQHAVIDTTTGDRWPAFDRRAVAEALARSLGEPVNSRRLRVERVHVGDDGVATLLIDHLAQARIARLNAGAITIDDVTTAPAEFLLQARVPGARLRSRSGSEDVNLVFINQTEGPVELFWINTEGGRQSYGTVEPGRLHRQHTFAGHAWVAADAAGEDLVAFIAGNSLACAVITGKVEREETGERGGNREGRREPRGDNNAAGRSEQHEVFFREHNAWLRDRETNEERQLTTDGVEDNRYGGRAHFSPDGSRVIVRQTAPGQEHTVSFVESSPEDQVQPKTHSFQYLKPGDRRAISRPRLFDAGSGEEIPVDNGLFENPWSLGSFHWSPDSSRFFFTYNQRGHQVLRVMAIDAIAGETRAIVDETSPTFIDYSNKQFLRYLDETNELIWMSERDGWNHLYLVDAYSGAVKNQITNGEWLVRGVENVDVENRQILCRVMGIHPQQDPYHIHYARVNFDGSELTVLTEADGTHAIDFSPNGELFIDTYSRVDLPPVHELRRTSDGSLVAELGRADWSDLLEAGWIPPERFVAKGRDGETDIYGMIFRPTNFDERRKYPVIESIYAGPHGQHVPKRFRSSYGEQALAELGFIVVKIDGMGTNWRSKAFHDVCWKNIADAGFPDRRLWMTAAARRYPFMDITRVGIYGGSAGGQNAMRAVLDHHDFYDAAFADCGCHDNRMDKVWWNEAWMGWPVDESYEKSSNVVDAHKLGGKLLLTVGELDRNVDPASTMQVVDALIKADKDFELIVFPGRGHGAGGSAYGRRRMYDFFVRELHGMEPRWE